LSSRLESVIECRLDSMIMVCSADEQGFDITSQRWLFWLRYLSMNVCLDSLVNYICRAWNLSWVFHFLLVFGMLKHGGVLGSL
ncbi:MAG: hypothetical protein KJO79_00455, partial [Verrucomicrobiae bacterium]|nr:hypothetical protein [Verrucomicrobiae bacterium]